MLVVTAAFWIIRKESECPGTYDESGIKSDYEKLIVKRAEKWFGPYVPASKDFFDFRFDYSNPKFAVVQFTVKQGDERRNFYGTYEACGSFELMGGELQGR